MAAEVVNDQLSATCLRDANPFHYCGEYFDSETGTYYLRARYYDPAIGRFTQADTHWSVANMIYGDTPRKINEREDALGLKTYTYAPQITAIMQSGNLYVYGVDNPVMYADISGNFVITTAALLVCGGALLFGTVGGLIGNHIANKNGITGWGRVGYIAGGAAIGAVGGGLLGYAAAPVVASATGVSGVSVTAYGISTVTATVSSSAEKIIQNVGASFKSLTQANFRFNLQTLTGIKDGTLQAHHVFPQKFVEMFNAIGINIHDPHYGAWVDASHQRWSYEYNQAWETFFNTVKYPTLQQTLDKALELAQKYNFTVYFK